MVMSGPYTGPIMDIKLILVVLIENSFIYLPYDSRIINAILMLQLGAWGYSDKRASINIRVVFYTQILLITLWISTFLLT